MLQERLASGDLDICNDFKESFTDITFAILDERGALDALPLLKDEQALDGDIVHCVHDMEKKAYTAAAEQALLQKLVAEEVGVLLAHVFARAARAVYICTYNIIHDNKEKVKDKKRKAANYQPSA